MVASPTKTAGAFAAKSYDLLVSVTQPLAFIFDDSRAYNAHPLSPPQDHPSHIKMALLIEESKLDSENQPGSPESQKTPKKTKTATKDNDATPTGPSKIEAGKFYSIFYSSAQKRKLGEKTPSPVITESAKKQRKQRKSKLPLVESKKQYAIDAGQMDFDASTCKVCHMIYTKGEITDEKTHADYHQLFSKSIKWYSWKNERVISTFDLNVDNVQYLLRCVAILPNDPKKCLNRVDSLYSIADRELGINMSLFDCKKESSVYLVMVARRLTPRSSTKSAFNATPKEDTPRKSALNDTICGFLSAEGIKTAYRLICENPLSISTAEEPASVGVSRIWIHHSFRRHGIASKLIDSLRANFLSITAGHCQGRILQRNEIAFSDPTDDGLAFAKKYTGQEKFLVFPFTL